jgi:RNA polymerase sigma factor FliA
MQDTGYRRDALSGPREMTGAGRSIKPAPESLAVPIANPMPQISNVSAVSTVTNDHSVPGRGLERGEPASRSGDNVNIAYPTPEEMGSLSAEQERMIVEHLPTVRYLARRIHERLPQHVDIEDMVSAGVLGLIDAFQKFDPAKKVQFRSYAQFRIRGAILDSLRTLDWSPRDLRRKGRAVEEAIRALTSQYGHAPSESEVAAQLEMDLSEYQQLLGELRGLEIGSLHVERSEDSGEEELAYIPSSREEDPLFRCLKGELQARLAAAIDQLPERERLVMTLYYYEEMTMKEIGLTLGVVESRVSQIHASGVLHLRVALSELGKNGPASESGRKSANESKKRG